MPNEPEQILYEQKLQHVIEDDLYVDAFPRVMTQHETRLQHARRRLSASSTL